MTQSERNERIEQAKIALLDILPAGSTVYTVLTNVSRSGMSRTIKCLVSPEPSLHGIPQIKDISQWASQALDWKLAKDKSGVIVSGCGMDMGFHMVYSLSQFLGYDVNGGKPVEGTNAYGLNHLWI